MKLHFLPKLVASQRVSVDVPPLTSGRNTSYGMATASYNKAQLRKVGLLSTIKVGSRTVVMDKKGVPPTVPIHRITAVPGSKSSKHAPNPGHAGLNSSSQAMSNMLCQQNDKAWKEVGSEVSLQTEYVTKRIVGHECHG